MTHSLKTSVMQLKSHSRFQSAGGKSLYFKATYAHRIGVLYPRTVVTASCIDRSNVKINKLNVCYMHVFHQNVAIVLLSFEVQ